MKKVIFTCMMLIVSAQLFAQSWNTTEFKADELKGIEAYTAYTYNDEKGNSFIYWSNTEKKIRIIDKQHLFNSSINNEVFITVGFYDDKGNLVKKKKDMYFSTINDTYNMAENRYGKEAAMILRYLKEEKGYIRFITTQFKTSASFDLKVPCLNK